MNEIAITLALFPGSLTPDISIVENSIAGWRSLLSMLVFDGKRYSRRGTDYGVIVCGLEQEKSTTEVAGSRQR